MMFLFDKNHAGVIIEAFNSTSTYIHRWLNIGNTYSFQMVSRVYPVELWFNEANDVAPILRRLHSREVTLCDMRFSIL